MIVIIKKHAYVSGHMYSFSGNRKKRDFYLVKEPTFGGLLPQLKKGEGDSTAKGTCTDIGDERVVRQHSGRR